MRNPLEPLGHSPCGGNSQGQQARAHACREPAPYFILQKRKTGSGEGSRQPGSGPASPEPSALIFPVQHKVRRGIYKQDYESCGLSKDHRSS